MENAARTPEPCHVSPVGGRDDALPDPVYESAVTADLEAELRNLHPELRAKLDAHGFDERRFLGWAAALGGDRDATNRLAAVEAPAAGDVEDLERLSDAEKTRLRAIGEASLRRGEVAVLVLAGGMATRMGSVVKALVEAIPGRTFLELRLNEHRHLREVYGVTLPLWLMTSEATHGPIAEALAAHRDLEAVHLFPQCVSLRLTPEGAIFRDATGAPSVYPTGHGDVPEALQKSGLLAKFRAKGGKYVWIENLDNVGATVDPLVLGWHVDRASVLTVELVDKAGDKGGIPVRHEGRGVVCEDFRLPRGFDASTVAVFNTNTFLCSAEALAGHDRPFLYVEVEKNVDGRKAIQRERLVGELTFHLPTRFLHVPREGLASRFLPVKSPEELAERRPLIEAIARARGLHR